MDLQTASHFLKLALEGQHGPIPAATLKQKVNAALIQQGHGSLDERALGFKKFSEFLDSQSSWIKLSRPHGAGDIAVSLRQTAPTLQASSAQPATIRNEIWQAFNNPDRNRRRYFSKKTGEVLHFIGEFSAEEKAIADSAADHPPIEPIASEKQISWMREFLDNLGLPQAERAAFDAMLGEQYSSALNLTFTRALGANAHAWREFRTQYVVAHIVRWANAAQIPTDQIERAEQASETPHSTVPPSLVTGQTARVKVQKLLEIISDEDLSKIVLPILLSTILVQSRL